MAQRYKGTVTKVNGNGDFGFISLRTVTLPNGKKTGLATRKDIFVHNDDCSFPIRIGDELTFALTDDDRRENAMRAIQVREASDYPIEGAVEIHFDNPVIDHPMVPIRWCIKPQLLDYMRQNAEKHWALVIVAQQRRRLAGYDVSWNPHRTVVMTVNGAERIGDGRGYINFRGSGDYDFVTYLVHSDERTPAFWSRLKHARDESQLVNVWTSDGDEIATAKSMGLSFLNSDDIVVAFSQMEVTVPADIFAKPLSEGTKAWLGYFGLNRPKDECGMRGRLIFAFTVGVALFLLFESVKRVWALVLGVLHFLFGGNPLPIWEMAFHPYLSAELRGVFCESEYEPMMDYHSWKYLLIPIVPLLAAGLVTTWFVFPVIQTWTLSIVTFVVGVVGLFTALHYWGVLQARKDRAEAKKKGELALARIQTFAVCDTGAPVKKGPVTVHLVFSGIKRSVCRMYGS